jgi:hypothetical protein
MDDAKALVDAVIEVLDDPDIMRAQKYARAVTAVAKSLAAMGVGVDDDLPRCDVCGEHFDEPENDTCSDCVAHVQCEGCGEHTDFDLSPSGLCHDCVNREIEAAHPCNDCNFTSGRECETCPVDTATADAKYCVAVREETACPHDVKGWTGGGVLAADPAAKR